MPLIQERLAAGQSVKNLQFQGCSMLPMLRQGKDTVELVSLPERLKKYDLPMYRSVGGKYVMHRVVVVKEDHYICLGDNTYTYEKVLPEQLIALVGAFKRGDRRISVDAPGYRLYCRVWCFIIPVRRFLIRVKAWIRRHLK